MEEMAIQTDKKQDKTLSRIQGSLIAGAAGDALGYEVEFLSDEAIQRRYGPQGITKYNVSATVFLPGAPRRSAPAEAHASAGRPFHFCSRNFFRVTKL